MIYIETNSYKAQMNLAYEEYFLNDASNLESVFMLWQNEPTIVVGRFQNSLEEINVSYIKEHNINLVRRITGGGTVYHDFGNLCYSFILRGIKVEDADFSIFARPIIRALKQLGVEVETNGRNDLTIDNKKISGTAMSLSKDSLLFHGTLLFDSDLEMLSKALKVSKDKISSKSHKSVKSRVTNIKPYIKDDKNDIVMFKNALKQELEKEFHFSERTLNQTELDKIKKIAEEKYSQWSWNYGLNPKCEIKNIKKYSGGILEVNLSIDQGRISECYFRGDFLGLCSIKPIEENLLGIVYCEEEIRTVLNSFDLLKHFGNIDIEEIINCLLPAQNN